MSEEITPEVFNHLVELAALELSPEEADYLRSELNKQLKSIHELASIPVSVDVPPARHGVPFPIEVSPHLREDIWKPYSNPMELLQQAPHAEENFYVVPDIPHTKLE